ncbi:helix-turn-helix transcriptional regulator [Micromonospora sp. LZ34]|uniref:helix-turn-helix transcriptional regulator n=1 Tax=Micromonospora TaxID=1873 RepID=UPI003719AE2E
MNKLLTTKEVLVLLGDVPRSTFYRWRQLGLGPRSIKLPNGEIRYRPADVDKWLRDHEEVAA